MTGKEVWQRLRSEGGFCWTHADGSITIHFNAGFKPSAELAALVRAHSADLKLFVMERNAAEERAATPPGLGSFGRIPRHYPTRDEHSTRDCNAKTRFGISSKCMILTLAATSTICGQTLSVEKNADDEILATATDARLISEDIGAVGGYGNARNFTIINRARVCCVDGKTKKDKTK